MGHTPENPVLRTEATLGSVPQNLGNCPHIVQDKLYMGLRGPADQVKCR